MDSSHSTPLSLLALLLTRDREIFSCSPNEIYIYTHATPLHQYTTRITTIVQSEEYLRHDAYVRDEKTTSRRTTTREAIHTRNLPAAAAARRRRHTCTRSPPAFHSFYRRVHRGWVPVHVNIYTYTCTHQYTISPFSLSLPLPLFISFFSMHSSVTRARRAPFHDVSLSLSLHAHTCLCPPPFSATWHCAHLVLKILAPFATFPSGASANEDIVHTLLLLLLLSLSRCRRRRRRANRSCARCVWRREPRPERQRENG